MQVVLETERMLLRHFTAGDVDHLIELDSDPEVMRFITGGRPTSREVIQHDILPAFLRSYKPISGLGVFAAIKKESGEFLGWFSFQAKDAAAPGEVSLGYRLRRAVWGQGYATEGARALIRKGSPSWACSAWLPRPTRAISPPAASWRRRDSRWCGPTA